MLKTKLKKESLETEIELLENHIKLKRQELRNSDTSLNEIDIEVPSNRLNCSFDTNKLGFGYKNCPLSTEPVKSPFSYEEVLFFENVKDFLKINQYQKQ